MAENPTGSTSDPTSLSVRAPTGPIATQTVAAFLRVSLLSFTYYKFREQRNPCIRSQRLKRKITYGRHDGRADLMPELMPGVLGHIPIQREMEKIDFPFPKAYNWSENPLLTHTAIGSSQSWEFRCRYFGLRRTMKTSYVGRTRPTYVVLGIFHHTHSNLQERVVFVTKPEYLFRELWWAVFRLRGTWRFIFSLKHVTAFKLFTCDGETGAHERVELDANGVADLQLMLDAYKSWRVAEHISEAWVQWIHRALNNGSPDVVKGKYGIEVVLGWSVARITTVVLLPVLLSLAIGCWINSKDWTDLATIQTAWGTASYIMTAGGLLAAWLAIFSSLTQT